MHTQVENHYVPTIQYARIVSSSTHDNSLLHDVANQFIFKNEGLNIYITQSHLLCVYWFLTI